MRDQVEAIEQVLAELAARHHLGQVAVGGRDDPHVHGRACWLEPSTSNVRSCSTRSSFTCDGGSSSPISSRKIVPPSRHLEAALAVLRARR